MLARNEGVNPSASIAGEVQTHAVFLRRVLAQLARAGLVEAREGRDGGYRLICSTDCVTLADIYRAVNVASPIAVHPVNFDTTCPGNAAMSAALGEIVDEAEERVLEVLERRTLADVISRAGELHASC
jgi:Rrf2 family protein